MISIPEPCSESWRKMTPDANGRFCGSCQKTVVDFTKKTNEEIADYFLKHGDVCGKYRIDQVETPKLAVRRKRWKWLATALIFVFGASFVASCRKNIPVIRTKGRKMPAHQQRLHYWKDADNTGSAKRTSLYSFLIGAVLFSTGCIMGKRYEPLINEGPNKKIRDAGDTASVIQPPKTP